MIKERVGETRILFNNLRNTFLGNNEIQKTIRTALYRKVIRLTIISAGASRAIADK